MAWCVSLGVQLCGLLRDSTAGPNTDNILVGGGIVVLHILYYTRQVENNSDIEVHLNTEATLETLDELKATKPHAVILASGGKPIITGRIPGIEKGLAYSDILSGKIKMEGKRVAVIGGGTSDLETAEKLIKVRGNKGTLIKVLPIVGNGIYFYNVRRTRQQSRSSNHFVL